MLRGAIAVVGQLFGHLQLVEATTMIDLIGPMTIYAGDSATYRLTVTDDADARVDLTGAAIEFQVKPTLGGADPPAIAKAVASGITLLAQSGDTLGQADITISSVDSNLTPKLYWLDVVVMLSGGRAHVIAPREYTIAPVVNGP